MKFHSFLENIHFIVFEFHSIQKNIHFLTMALIQFKIAFNSKKILVIHSKKTVHLFEKSFIEHPYPEASLEPGHAMTRVKLKF